MYAESSNYPAEKELVNYDLDGSCLCGSLKYSASGELLGFYHCHCTRCQKANGAGHASIIFLKNSKLCWRAGEELLCTYQLPEAESFGTSFCSNCGSQLPRFNKGSEVLLIPAGSLDENFDQPPAGNLFWDSRASWSCHNDLPKFATYPEPVSED